MNNQLTAQIINHVFYGFGVVNNYIVDPSLFNSIKSKQYLLPEKITFLDANNKESKNNIWGLQLSIENKNFRILLADCTTDSDLVQYSGIFHLEENPIYGISLSYSSDSVINPLIAFSLEGKNWMPCSTFLQATFLAGMENIKEVKFNWNKCNDYQSEYQALLGFVKFYDKFYEDTSEG